MSTYLCNPLTESASGKARRPMRSSASAARRRSVSGCTGSVAAAVLRSQTGPQFSPRSWIASRARRARGSGCPDPRDTPDHGAVHSAHCPCQSRAMQIESIPTAAAGDEMSGHAAPRRLPPQVCAFSLPPSKTVAVRAAESHFNPTLSHFVPLCPTFRPTFRPESRGIPPNPAEFGFRTLSAPCPGISHLATATSAFASCRPASLAEAGRDPGGRGRQADCAGRDIANQYALYRSRKEAAAPGGRPPRSRGLGDDKQRISTPV